MLHDMQLIFCLVMTFSLDLFVGYYSRLFLQTLELTLGARLVNVYPIKII